MIKPKHPVLMMFVALALNGCSQPPTEICQMPQNRHFWQGLDIRWRGQIIDLQAPPHGGGIYFTDYTCGASVSIDRDVVPSLFSPKDDFFGHAAVADFAVEGRLSYKNGAVVLRPTSLRRISPWGTQENGGFDAYMRKRRAKSIRDGLLTTPR